MGHVSRIKEGWDITKEKAVARLEVLRILLLNLKKQKRKLRRSRNASTWKMPKKIWPRGKKIFADTKNVIDTMFNSIQKDYDCMTLTLPDDKKDFVKKEVKAVSEKLEVVGRFKEKVDVIDDEVKVLNNLDEIRNHSHKLTPEDRVSSTMELQEDVAEKVEI